MGVEALPRTIEWVADTAQGGLVRLVDQRALPCRLEFLDVRTAEALVDAIKRLAVRGAPALGLAGAWGVCLAAQEATKSVGEFADADTFLRALEPTACRVAQARPTAVNLEWGVQQVLGAVRARLDAGGSASDALEAALCRAGELACRDEADNRAIGAHGAALLPEGARVITHCNAGSLACGFYGTALGVVYAAFEAGKLARVYADETRPVGQGARLTMWELSRAGVPCTLECDGMAASLMSAGKVDAVVVGADRIAANGDVANKVGTYQLAIAAAYHGVPFYVAAPSSTIDATLLDGAGIPIEFRDGSEVLETYGLADGMQEEGARIGIAAPNGRAVSQESACAQTAGEPVSFDVYNPAFDVTPARLVTAIVTEEGVFDPGDIVRAQRSASILIDTKS